MIRNHSTKQAIRHFSYEGLTEYQKYEHLILNDTSKNLQLRKLILIYMCIYQFPKRLIAQRSYFA